MNSLEPGAQADITLVDPEALSRWDSSDARQLVYRDIFEHEQMVNRSDGVVTTVLIGGVPVWRAGTSPLSWAAGR